MTKKQLSILLIDDHDTIVSGLKYELQNDREKSFINVAYNTSEAMEYCNIVSFDIAIMDISFKSEANTDGIQLAKTIKRNHPHIKILIYSGYAEKVQLIQQLIELKADAIVAKLDGNKSVKKAIECIQEEKTPYYSPIVEEAIKNDNTQKKIHISKRERDVILLLQKHLTYKEIAHQLGITKNTVDFHAKNLYSKFGAHKITELLEKVKDHL